jgi:hypothetical protein
VSTLALLTTVGFLWLRLQRHDGLEAVELGRFERQIQRLDAGIPIDAHQQRLLLGMRDRILLANPSIGVEAAYRYSLSILEATKIYPSVPPLLLLSMGLKGSRFEADAVGPDGVVRGFYRIDPTRARMLARALNWEFREEMLLDPDVNTRMAALLLDVLFTEHRDTELVLADYYGGAGAPGLLRTETEAVPPETRRLILEIKDLYEELRAVEEMESGLVSRSSSVADR